MTQLNPQEAPQGMLAAGIPGASEIPHNLRQTSSEDMIPQPLNAQGILPDPSQSATEPDAEDYDVATSLGASINESMLMPPETLAAGLSPSPNEADPGRTNLNRTEFDGKTWNRSLKAAAQNIRRNPYPYIAGALGFGLFLARRMGSRRAHSI